jgi:hypothetical protein
MESIPFRTEDRRYQDAVLKLLRLIKTKPSLEKDITEALDDVGRHLSGQAFGASEALQQEHREIMDRVRGFDMAKSPAFQAFKQRQITGRKFPEIVSICELLAEQANVPMDRESKRRKPLLFRWLDANWDRIEPALQTVTLVFEGEIDQPL